MVSKPLTDKQKNKIKAKNRAKNRNRVREYRRNKKQGSDSLIQFYLDYTRKDVLKEYQELTGMTYSEIFTDLIDKIIKRRLNNDHRK